MTCRQCGKPLNPVQAMLGPVCGSCSRDNHAKVTGRKPRRPRGQP